MYIKREMTNKIKDIADKFPFIAITGPRQSGKTTLAKKTFPNADYVSLESPDNREFALNDPRGFIESFKGTVIIDEIQNVPILFPYLQEYSDKYNQNGKYILTGSQNFTLVEKITQSLAGRIFIFKLLPFSMKEISRKKIKNDLNDTLLKGFYPRLFDNNIEPEYFYPQYIQTYIERDVRQIKNISDLSQFQRFLKICAGRHGQVINLSEIGNQVGISHNTVKSWLSILEESFIIYLLRPYFKNYNKRIIKNPKLYFLDSGLVSSLLQIQNKEQLDYHFLKGAIFEGFVICEKLKEYYNKGKRPQFYFWRDSNGKEIDLIIDKGSELELYEMKSSKTFNPTFFKNINLLNKVFKDVNTQCNLIYGGEKCFIIKEKNVISWKNI